MSEFKLPLNAIKGRGAATRLAHRFARDVREHRKPIAFLLQRGIALYRSDPDFRRRHLEAGFVPLSKRRLKAALAGV